MAVTANRVWRQLSEEIRISVSKVFWTGAKGADKQFLIIALARAKNLREVFVRKSPVDRLVNWTAATLTLPDPIVDDLMKKFLLDEHRGVIVEFLELLQIPHSEGMIEESFDYTILKEDAVEAAARKLLQAEDRIGAEVYLKYLTIQGGPWTGVEKALEDLQ